MPRFILTRASAAALVTLAAGLTACSDQLTPPSMPPAEHAALHGSTAASPAVFISSLSLSSDTLVLGGTLGYTATIVSQLNGFANIGMRVSIHQGVVHFLVSDTGVPCSTSPCTFSGQVQAPAGVLPGLFRGFELLLYDKVTGLPYHEVELPLTIVASQSIPSLSLATTTLAIGGASTSFLATIQNPGDSVSGASVQGSIIQSEATFVHHVTVSGPVQCGGVAGFLPHGSCSQSGVVSASNATGNGTLVPGPAQFELVLVLNNTVYARQTVNITLVPSVSISGVTLNSVLGDTLLIEGASVSYTATLQNPGASLSGLSLQAQVVQGSAARFAGSVPAACGSAPNVLPNGTCLVTSQATATDNTAGSGTLVTGGAALEFQIVDAAGNVLATTSVPVTLIEGPLTSPPPGPGSNDRAPVRKPSRP
jgi:hypothetical protein